MPPLSQGLHLPLSDTLFGCCCSLFQTLQLKYFTDIFIANSTSMPSLKTFGKIKVCGTSKLLFQSIWCPSLLPETQSPLWGLVLLMSFLVLDLCKCSRSDRIFNYFTFQCIRACNGLGKVKARTCRAPKIYYWEFHAGDRNYMITVVKCSSHSS